MAGNAATTQQQFTIPGGPEKTWPLHKASARTLEYWVKRISEALESGESQNARRDTQLVAAMRAELASRGDGKAGRAVGTAGRQQQQRQPREPEREPAPSMAIVRAEVDKLSGSYRTPAEAFAMMRSAAGLAHLVTPQESVGELPAGCAVSATAIWIDADKETYGIPHKDSYDRCLDKVALHKIAAAAGVDWDPAASGRLDNGSNPHYVHFRAVGRVRNFDGSLRTETGEVEIDLRDGSDEFVRMTDKVDKHGNPIESKELPTARKFILRVAESKAKNRVIRDLGVRAKYTREDLEKPFVVVKLAFTGHTDDPELRRLFATSIAESFLGGARALYAPPAAALPSGGHVPPDVSQTSVDDDEDEDEREPGDDGDDDDNQYADEGEDFDHVTGEVNPKDGKQTSLKV